MIIASVGDAIKPVILPAGAAIERLLETDLSILQSSSTCRMWARELGDLLEVLPYYLLVALPVFIILSPINPCEAASELDVHRLAQFELTGNTHGSKHAALTMDAR